MTVSTNQSMIGQTVEMSVAWGSQVGKTVGTFLGEIVDTAQGDKNDAYLAKIIEFKHCWYKSYSDSEEAYVKSPLLTCIDQLPEPLRYKVQAFIGTVRTVPKTVTEERLAMYVNNPLLPI